MRNWRPDTEAQREAKQNKKRNVIVTSSDLEQQSRDISRRGQLLRDEDDFNAAFKRPNRRDCAAAKQACVNRVGADADSLATEAAPV